MKPLIVVNVLLILIVALAQATSIPIARKPNKIIENPTINQQRLLAGDSIPLEGGLLVLGTYVISVQVGTPPVTVSMIVRILQFFSIFWIFWIFFINSKKSKKKG